MRLAVDGWSLIERPCGPATAHLLELLEGILSVAPSFEVAVLHPTGEPLVLPEGLRNHPVSVRLSEWGRLVFEQRVLVNAAADLGADLLSLHGGSAPLVSKLPVAAAAAMNAPAQDAPVIGRIRWALGQAGMRGAAAVLAYSDTPSWLEGRRNLRHLPPAVGGDYRPIRGAGDERTWRRYGLHSGYVLSYGAEGVDLPFLLAAWTWVDGSLGDANPLVLLGLLESEAEEARRRAAGLDLLESVRILTKFDIRDLPSLYRGASAFLHPGYSEIGQELRWAMASGVPIAAVDTQLSTSVLGKSAYLTPRGDARALGAACLTLLVEPDAVAKPLQDKGLIQARGFHGERPWAAYAGALKEASEARKIR